MKRKFAKISAAALAGASCMLVSNAKPANAALSITAIRTANQVFTNGTYDVIVFQLTGLTGPDATTGLVAGKTADAEVLGLSGTFTVTGGTGNPEMATVGAAGSQEEGNTLLSTTLIGPGPASNAAAQSRHSSYLAFTSDTATFTSVNAVGDTQSANKGNSLSFGDSWYTTPSAPVGGNAGGVEPGKDPHGLVGLRGASPSTQTEDIYAVNGMLAEILVNPGANVSFTGTYSDFGFTSGNATTFTSAATSITTTGSNKIISLVTTGAPTGTAPNGYGTSALGTLTVSNAGGSGKYFPGYFNVAGGASTGFIAVKGFLPGDSPEVYALQVAINGVELAPTDTRLAAIIADIEGSDSNISSGVTTVVGSPYAALFPGYDIIVPSSIAGGATPYFAFDFSTSDGTDTDTALGAVTVTSIAAVPEPATAAGVILGAAGLLLGRRKNKAVAV